MPDIQVIKGLYILYEEDIVLTLSYKCQTVYSPRDQCVTIFMVDGVRQIANNFSWVKYTAAWHTNTPESDSEEVCRIFWKHVPETYSPHM